MVAVELFAAAKSSKLALESHVKLKLETEGMGPTAMAAAASDGGGKEDEACSASPARDPRHWGCPGSRASHPPPRCTVFRARDKKGASGAAPGPSTLKNHR